MIPSYPQVYALGHKAIAELLSEPCLVQEKVDGSQFSFSADDRGILHCRSRGAEIILDAPGMFAAAVHTAMALEERLPRGWFYRGEFLAKPKHNTLAYTRVPVGGVVLFDISTGPGAYLPSLELAAEGERLGLEVVPNLGTLQPHATPGSLLGFLERESFLGGTKIEGVVVKNYRRFGIEGHPLFGKYVSEAFKEKHQRAQKDANARGDIIHQLSEVYRTDARWDKAVQHLRELGVLEDDPRDIGKLIHEIVRDVELECTAEIQEALWAWAWPKLKRTLTAGFPEHYKRDLLEKQFEAPCSTSESAAS